MEILEELWSQDSFKTVILSIVNIYNDESKNAMFHEKLIW